MRNHDEAPTTYDVTNFTVREVTECGRAVRTMGVGASSMEEVAGRIVRYLHNTLIDGETGERACSLIRFFKTHAYEGLDDELKAFALNMLGGRTPLPGMKCLTLLGTVGENQEWNSIRTSKGHKAIPLPSEKVVYQIPMLRDLLQQLGLSMCSVVKPDPGLMLDMEQKTYNVFLVPEALGSPYIPAQKEFVVPYGIKSVVAFGGVLPSLDIFVIIMFLRTSILRQAADFFKNLSLNIKLAVLPFEKTVFAHPRNMEDNGPAVVENQLLKSQVAGLEQLLDVYETSVLEKTNELYAEITKRRQIEEALRQSEERYRTIIDEMEEWYFEINLEGNITFFNDIFPNVLGYSRKELIGLNFQNVIKKENSDSVSRLFHQVVKTGKPTKNFPYEFICLDGKIIFVEFSIFPKLDKESKIVGFRGVGHDITERKHAEDRIQYLATHDSLTNLPNRLMFNQLLNHSIQSARHHKRQLAVFFIDLDRFKIINDTMGHEAGDQLLQEIAQRFKQTLRAADVIGRLGGDEFIILIEEVNDLSHIAIVARKILTNTSKPMVLRGEECRITASIGISIYPKHGEDELSLMKNADIAMYFAKEEGKNNYQFYSEDIQSQSTERLSLESNLRFALERNEFSLHYQAKVDFKTNVITGVEALLRWQNPCLGSVTPTQFIPVAEETGLIIPIGKWVMKTACAQNVAWQKEGLPNVCMAINLSLRQLMDENLIDAIKEVLKDSGMAPNLLESEITESTLMHNPTHMIAELAKIKSMGVRIAIDDFGTGYSSLAQIKNFPINTIKVDRSFIRNIPNNAEDKAITEAIITMGKTLNLTVIAEGVETIEQMNFLKEHSCDEMQGYYFSKPIVPKQFANLLRKHVPAPLK